MGIRNQILLLLALALAAPAPAQSLNLIGEDGTRKTLTAADLAALPQVEVVSEERGGARVTYRGPLLRALVTEVGAPTGRNLRGPAMTIVVLAEARDGYKVAYALAEIDDQFGARQAIVAISADGKPLPEADGPLRVVVAGEEHRARWIRQLSTLRLVRVNAVPPGDQATHHR
jgi:hypothetical protein